MKFINFLNEVDWSKNIIFFIIYTMIIFFCLAFYFIPIMQNHKLQTLDYKRTQNLNNAINANIQKLQNEMNITMQQNANTHQNMRNKIDIAKLEEYTKRYFNNATIKDQKITDSNNNITIQSIAIEGYAKHTKEVIDFIDNIKELNHSIRTSFPINIIKQKDLLKVDLKIQIYYSDYKF